MVTDNCQTGESLPIRVSRLIAFRFVTIDSYIDNSHSFQWLTFEGASSYIVQLSTSDSTIFRETILATDDFIQTYSYKEALLKPGIDYLFTVEVDPKTTFVDCCNVNNEKNIAECVTQGISKIKELDLFSKLKVTILTQLDYLLISREEILNITWSIVRQGSQSDIIGFLNYFLAQGSAFKLLADTSHADDVINALSRIAIQLAAANITLSEYLQLSGLQLSLADNLVRKAMDLALFAKDIQDVNFEFPQLTFRTALASNRCDPDCSDPPYSRYKCFAFLRHKCGGCRECDPSNR